MDISLDLKKRSTALRPRNDRLNARGRETLDPISRAASLGRDERLPSIRELLERSVHRSDQVGGYDYVDEEFDPTDNSVFDTLEDDPNAFGMITDLPASTPFTDDFADEHGPTIVRAYEALKKAGQLPKAAPKGKKPLAKTPVETPDPDDLAGQDNEDA